MSALSNGNVVIFKDIQKRDKRAYLKAKAAQGYSPEALKQCADGWVTERWDGVPIIDTPSPQQTDRQMMWDELRGQAAKLLQIKNEQSAASPLPDSAPDDTKPEGKPALSQHIGEILAHPTTVRWLKRDEIERGVIAVMSGPRGSCKTASARRWVMHVAVNRSKNGNQCRQRSGTEN
jgi:hypothetical protein